MIGKKIATPTTDTGKLTKVKIFWSGIDPWRKGIEG